MKLTHMDEAYWAERRIAAEREFPGSSYGVRPDLTAEVVDRFEDALHAESEEAIQNCLTENPYLVQYAISNSGHHGTWVYPKQMIRPKAATGEPGLIPDFLAVTRSSLGDHWWVVELKRFDTQFADAQGGGMSPMGHKAVSQAAGYLSHFREYIDAIRSHVRIPRLTQPSGALILIGDSQTESEAQRTVRSNFVRTATNIDVASYRRIVVHARMDVGFTRNSRPFRLEPMGRSDLAALGEDGAGPGSTCPTKRTEGGAAPGGRR
ncbi:MAG: DUF4263 domain-containing protein [Brevundimonas sp.]|nr:MAG: DUF4263 domain-containing protein [Brevundimonas sp.]